jgi:hypothetical protein
MWPNSIGTPFILPPKHAAVFREAAADFSAYADMLEDAGENGSVFERLTLGQKQLAILIVARALLDQAIEPPRITAVLAGTVAAIYEHVQTMVAVEIEEREGPTIRRMLLDALDENNTRCDPEPLARVSPTCPDMDEWWGIIESLRDTVLEDHDFNMEALFLDVPPEEAAALKALMRIDPDYFVTPIADPSPQDLEKIRTELRSLLSQG